MAEGNEMLWSSRGLDTWRSNKWVKKSVIIIFYVSDPWLLYQTLCNRRLSPQAICPILTLANLFCPFSFGSPRHFIQAFGDSNGSSRNSGDDCDDCTGYSSKDRDGQPKESFLMVLIMNWKSSHGWLRLVAYEPRGNIISRGQSGSLGFGGVLFSSTGPNITLLIISDINPLVNVTILLENFVILVIRPVINVEVFGLELEQFHALGPVLIEGVLEFFNCSRTHCQRNKRKTTTLL